MSILFAARNWLYRTCIVLLADRCHPLNSRAWLLDSDSFQRSGCWSVLNGCARNFLTAPEGCGEETGGECLQDVFSVLLWRGDDRSMALPRHMLEFAPVGTLEKSKMLFAHPR